MNKFKITKDFTEYTNIFLNENSKLNLISKNDEKFLYEKHIYDSLSIKLFFEKYNIQKADLIDIGCGGGFPSVPIAIECPNINVLGVDSIQKKIKAISNIKQALNIKNLDVTCQRIENIKHAQYDIVTSRAVAELSKILEYGLPLLKQGGYFIAYKSKKIFDELNRAEQTMKKYNAKMSDIIEYTLPLDIIYKRYLIVITL